MKCNMLKHREGVATRKSTSNYYYHCNEKPNLESKQLSTINKMNIQLVQSKTKWSTLATLLVTICLPIIIMSSLCWFVVLLYLIGIDSESDHLYGHTYYWWCCFYSLSLSIILSSKISTVINFGPTKVAHLALMMLAICMIEILIFTRIIFSLIEMVTFSGI